MADDELTGLSREELLELVRRQREELATREAAIERRDEKIRELEEELAQFRRPVTTPDNSSVPPSRRQKANRVERRCGSLVRSEGTSEPIGCAASRTWSWPVGRARVRDVVSRSLRPV